MRTCRLIIAIWLSALMFSVKATAASYSMAICPDIIPNNASFFLTREFMADRVNVANHLANMVNREEYGPIEALVDDQREIFERFDGFSDFDDQSLVAKTKDTQICFATFQSTDPGNGWVAFLLDQWQNMNPFQMRIGDTDCFARRGYIDAYNATYKEDFRKSLDACVASCGTGEDQCPLVLGGFSQGGSAAVVAAIDLAHYNPQVITFGSARVVVNRTDAPCTTSINPDNHFRFVTYGMDGQYDVVPNQLNVWNERHVGHLFLLDVDDYAGDDNVMPLVSMPTMNDNLSRQPTTWDLHDDVLYRERIDALLALPCYPIAVAAWPSGHPCRYDDECAMGTCQDQVCV